MSIVVESTTTAPWATGSTTFTQNKPTGTVDGDFLIAIVFTGHDNSGSAPTVTTAPTGWTLVNSVTQTDGIVYTYKKVASSEGASWDWTLSASGVELFYAGCVFRLSGTNQVDAFDDGSAVNDATPTFTTGVTPVGANGLLIMATVFTGVATGGQSTSAYAVTTDNPTWTELLDSNGGEGAGAAVHCSVAYAIRTAATATGDWTLTGTGSATIDSVSQLLSLPAITNVTASPAVVTMTLSVQAPTVTGGALVTPAVITITATIQAPTVTLEAHDWANTTKNSTSSFVNTSKS